MTPVLDQRQTSSGVASRPHRGMVDLSVGLLVGSVFGTNAGVRTVRFAPIASRLTTGPVVQMDTFLVHDPAANVRRMRDQISARGLSRHDIARAVGVDRRSLSGWASGEIRPTPERLRLLTILAELVDTIDAERPGRARDILLSRRGRVALVDQITTSGQAILHDWRLWLARQESSVSVTRRSAPMEPIWAAAARALAEGGLSKPDRAHTVRPESTYEMEPTEATAFTEREYESQRRG
jgi:transcriptional regulator with XRE-family HTH domain